MAFNFLNRVKFVLVYRLFLIMIQDIINIFKLTKKSLLCLLFFLKRIITNNIR